MDINHSFELFDYFFHTHIYIYIYKYIRNAYNLSLKS